MAHELTAPPKANGSTNEGHDQRSSEYELAGRQAIGGAPSQSQPATVTRLAASATRPRARRHASLASPSMRQIASAARRIDARALHMSEQSPAFSNASAASSNSEKSAVIAFSICGVSSL